MRSVPRSLEQLRSNPTLLLFECMAGSRAYGTVVSGSDEDLRGIYALPASAWLALEPPEAQLADARGDQVYYSLRRTLELLATGNPNQLELLWMPEDCIRHDSAEMQLLRNSRLAFLTRAAVRHHIGYAQGQIGKARGQHKWVNQPQPEQAPSREDFCRVIPLSAQTPVHGLSIRPRSLDGSGVKLSHCHAARLEHCSELYRLYDYGPSARGVFRNGQLVCEAIPLADEQTHFVGLLLYREAAWAQAVNEHRNYWTWRRERNPARWLQQERGELDYDAKNLMHTLRLLYSGRQILLQHAPRVRFEGDALQHLLDIRIGRFSYAELLEQSAALMAECNELLPGCDLPEQVDQSDVNELLYRISAAWERRCG